MAGPRLFTMDTDRLRKIYADAACDGYPLEIFFPDEDEEDYDEKVEFAKMVCNACDVIDDCRAHGIEYEEYGIWGGLTERERKRIND